MIKVGDCRELMDAMDHEIYDSVITDPPYEIGFMGRLWDSTGVAFNPDTWCSVLRVAKSGAHLLAFGGTRTFHRLICAIEDAGWEIRDCIMWVYGSGFPKSHNLHGDWQGWGTALKPAWEPIIVARKPLRGTVAANVERYGTGALNINACRVGIPHSYRITGSAVGCGRERPCNLVDRGDGKTPDGRDLQKIRDRQDGYREAAKNAAPVIVQGRWPANLIHDGGDEVTALFPNSGPTDGRAKFNGEHKSVARGADKEHVSFSHNDAGGNISRFFYCAKADNADRHTEIKNIHPTVKPTRLMRYLCRLVTPPGGTVFDPFTGSGSTGKAAVIEGFQFEGCELSEEYARIAEARITKIQHGLSL